MAKVKERTMHIVFLVAACMSILAVAMICLFMFANGVPAIRKIGFVNFIFGKTWMPGANKFGIFAMIIGKYLCDSRRDHHRCSDRTFCVPSSWQSFVHRSFTRS